jgi:hypothetical protein
MLFGTLLECTIYLDTTGKRGTIIGGNKFIDTNEFISKYIRRYLKLTNVGYIHRFGLNTDESDMCLITSVLPMCLITSVDVSS